MSNAFIGEIRLVAFNNVPTGWLSCDGQSLSTSGNAALFALLGYTYGGKRASAGWGRWQLCPGRDRR